MDQPTPADPSEYGERTADVYDQWFPASAEQLTTAHVSAWVKSPR
jgi:hypothetical protein